MPFEIVQALFCGSELDFNFNAGRKFKTRKSFNCLLRRLDYVDQSLVGSDFELLSAVLVLVDCAQDCNDFLLRGERNGTGNFRAVSLCGLNDLLRCGIDQSVIVAFESDSDFFACCHCSFASCLRFLSRRRRFRLSPFASQLFGTLCRAFPPFLNKNRKISGGICAQIGLTPHAAQYPKHQR